MEALVPIDQQVLRRHKLIEDCKVQRRVYIYFCWLSNYDEHARAHTKHEMRYCTLIFITRITVRTFHCEWVTVYKVLLCSSSTKNVPHVGYGPVSG